MKGRQNDLNKEVDYDKGELPPEDGWTSDFDLEGSSQVCLWVQVRILLEARYGAPPLLPALSRQRQGGLCELTGSLV